MASNFIAPLSVPDYFTELRGYNSATGLIAGGGGAAADDYGTPAPSNEFAGSVAGYGVGAAVARIFGAASGAQILPTPDLSLSVSPSSPIGANAIDANGNYYFQSGGNEAPASTAPYDPSSLSFIPNSTGGGSGPDLTSETFGAGLSDFGGSSSPIIGDYSNYGTADLGPTAQVPTEQSGTATATQSALAPLMRALGLNTSPSPTGSGTGGGILDSITSAIKTITDPVVWQRIGVVVLGLVILLAALFLFGFGSRIEVATSHA